MGPGQRKTTRDGLARFANELSAYEYVEHILWPNGPRCPHCGSEGRVGKLNGASTRIGAYKCYNCRKTFSVTPRSPVKNERSINAFGNSLTIAAAIS